jgi:hypothetical protein
MLVSNGSSGNHYQASDAYSGHWQPQQQQQPEGLWQQQQQQQQNGKTPSYPCTSEGDNPRRQGYPLPHPPSWSSFDGAQQGNGHLQLPSNQQLPPQPPRGSVSARQTPRNASRSSLFEQDDDDNFKARIIIHLLSS